MTDRERLRAEIAMRAMAAEIANGTTGPQVPIFAVRAADALLAALGQPERESDDLNMIKLAAKACDNMRAMFEVNPDRFTEWQMAADYWRARSAAGKGE